MNQRDSSHSALIWLSDGHVSDWVLNVLVDDEVVLVPEDAVSHVDSCEHCTERMATTAHLAFALAEELSRVVSPQAKQSVPFPWRLFAAATLFTVSFAVFSWATRGTAIVETPHDLLTVWRGVRLIGPFAAQRLGIELIVLSSLTTLAAAIGGVILAKRHPFPRSPESPS